MDVTDFLETLTEINDQINSFVWVKIGIWILLGAGLATTCATGFFQVTHIKHWFKETFLSIFEKSSGTTKKRAGDAKAISQFQALCTALSATIGTGNIAGVSGAIVIGGPGAVFWMWVAAFLGMMTNYSENTLGIYYRRKNSAGEWNGGAMYYLQDGLGGKKGMKGVGKFLAVLFSIFAALASFGIGNMGQVNKIVLNLDSAFFSGIKSPEFLGVPVIHLGLGFVILVLAWSVIIGGLQRIAQFAEKVIPFMSLAYIIGCIVVFATNISQVGAMFEAIFKFAFGVDAVAGGFAGIIIKDVITQGCKRGVFSNEAGLGSSVMVHSASNVREPVRQGMWGIFEVFFDTIIVCTMTAIVVLSSGAIDLETGAVMEGVNDATLVSTTFGMHFGKIGEIFVALAILLFAFTTILGWSQYGSKSIEYLFGEKAAKPFKVIFTLMIISGATMSSSLAWDISDTFNGLMMIPNLIGVFAMLPMVHALTKNYVDRKIKGQDIKPMLSYDPDIQAAHEEDIRNGMK